MLQEIFKTHKSLGKLQNFDEDLGETMRMSQESININFLNYKYFFYCSFSSTKAERFFSKEKSG